MPLKLPKNLPAIEVLKNENIFVMDSDRANSQDIRPLHIAILNLMPLKERTELDLIRLLSNTPLQLDITFVRVPGHESKNTSSEHIERFYTSFEELMDRKFDGMIITGAPLEHLDFEDVTYWPWIQTIFDWSRTHVTSTMYICWASQAALYHFYNIPKYDLPEKMFGIFKHHSMIENSPIFRGFDDVFYVPHSRHTEVRSEDIEKVDELTIMAESWESGVYMVMARDGREIFVTGHSEYAPDTLDTEYKRDLSKGLPIKPPVNYYKDNDPNQEIIVRWRSTANLFFSNWLNYYVYQLTPFDINEIH
ncbi:MAG: homoserine O-succinyltransferase [Bacteroidales bacterium]|nr:homoserine O-succinyltransferase [Bacteroidales bacterium]